MQAHAIKKHLPTIILVGVLLLGVCLLAYPSVSDWWNSQHATRAITTYSDAVENLTQEDYDAILEDAQAYNAELAKSPTGYVLFDSQMSTYSSKLNVEGTDVMGTLEIDRINVKLPIYHGTDDGVLQIGIGHYPGSSLPIGGLSTHAVLMGHRGLPSAELLTNLDRLEVGDTFKIAVLNESLYYEVDQILIVEPTDVSELAIQEGKDLCTLVTCTPYGVNTHRLLVRGHRVDGPDLGAHLTADAVRVEPVLVACAVALPLLVLLAIVALVRGRRGR